MLSHSRRRLIWWIVAAAVVVLLGTVCSVGVVAAMHRGEYPNAERLAGVGNCGTMTTYRYGRTLRLSRHLCLVTADSKGKVDAWYRARGHEWLSQGQHRFWRRDFGLFHVVQVERVYAYVERGAGPNGADRTNIRIYRDTILHVPRSTERANRTNSQMH